MKTLALGFALGVLAVLLTVLLYFKLGTLPVAVADKPFPRERRITHMALDARIEREAPREAPIPATDDNRVAGAQIYRRQCAACHGLPNSPSSFAPNMYPRAPQLWMPHGKGVVGVSDDSAGETYWKVANGIRLTGMPSYRKTLSETEMWQVSLLLADADKPQPAAATTLLSQPITP